MAETSSSEGPSLSIGAIVGFFIVVAVAVCRDGMRSLQYLFIIHLAVLGC